MYISRVDGSGLQWQKIVLKKASILGIRSVLAWLLYSNIIGLFLFSLGDCIFTLEKSKYVSVSAVWGFHTPCCHRIPQNKVDLKYLSSSRKLTAVHSCIKGTTLCFNRDADNEINEYFIVAGDLTQLVYQLKFKQRVLNHFVNPRLWKLWILAKRHNLPISYWKGLESKPCLTQVWIRHRPRIYGCSIPMRRQLLCIAIIAMLFKVHWNVFTRDVHPVAWNKSIWNCYLLQYYGLQVIKPKQTLVQPTKVNHKVKCKKKSHDCKELNSYLCKCGQFLYIWGWFIQMRLSFIHLREGLYNFGVLYI